MGNTGVHATVIDLAAISGPARQVVALYDQIRQGNPPTTGQLDDALDALRAAPRPPGRLGHYIALLTTGGAGAEPAVVIDALERLRTITTIQPQAPPSPRRTRRERRRAPRPTFDQPQLPGLTDTQQQGTL